jgi:hypothetical protein
MKKFILTLSVLISINLYGQEIAGGELIIYFTDLPEEWEIFVNIEAVGTHWDCNHYLTEEYSGGDSLYSQNSSRYNHASDACWHYDGYDPTLGLGLYIITVGPEVPTEGQGVYFLIDWRTSDLPPSTGWDDQDFEYSFYQNKIYRKWDPNKTSIHGQTLAIWDENEEIELDKTNLEPLPPANISVEAFLGHPKISWTHNTNQYNHTGYKIYRYVDTGIGQFGDFTFIGSRTSSATSYVDWNLETGSGWIAYYVVTAINGASESINSDTVDIQVSAPSKYSAGSSGDDNFNDFSNELLQNFPNPFNPVTTITFSIKEDLFVELKIYDILGREVDVLINGQLTAGSHSINFNASNLESGIYFYEIKTNKFRAQKKLLLLK